MEKTLVKRGPGLNIHCKQKRSQRPRGTEGNFPAVITWYGYLSGVQVHPGAINPFQLTHMAGLIRGLRPASERRRYFVTTSLIGWAQA